MTETNDYESVVQIDENHLDKECIRLPGDYLRFSILAADKRREYDEAEAELKVVIAEVSKAVREAPDDYGIEKVTVEAVNSAVLTHPRVIKYQKRALAKKHGYDVAQAVVWSLEHKKRSLTLMVNLHGMGYFSDVPMSAEGKDAVNKMLKGKVRTGGNRSRPSQEDDED